jgi:hypothetical protein
MCVGSTPAAPAPPPKLPEAPQTPEPATREGETADERRRRLAAGGATTGTILTGPQGITDDAPIGTKTLLGQ